MTINLSAIKLWELLEKYTVQCDSHPLIDNNVYKLIYPPDLGQGYKENILLSDDLTITIHNYHFNQDLVIDNSEGSSNYVEFAFKLVSSSQINYNLYTQNKYSYLINKHHQGCIIKYSANQLNYGLDIHLGSNFIEKILSENNEPYLVNIFKQLSKKQENFNFISTLKIAPELQFIITQMINCPYQGGIKQLYLEGKSLELIARYLQLLLECDRPYFSQSSSFNSSDIEAIYQAKEIIEKNFDNPPSLSELATQVRLTNRKLEEGFRKTFNHSVFGYLRQHRLEIARQLLEDKEISISTISSLVGYASHSAFTHAFQKQFGVTPKAYQKAI